MPQASELEEFGLEVEHEHHALMSEQQSGNANNTNTVGIGSGSASSSYTPSKSRQRHPFSLSHPSKEQRSLLQSSNFRPSRFPLRPGMLKWATVILALAILVFLHVGQESEEAAYVEEVLLGEGEVEICEDDDLEFTAIMKSEKSCRTFVEHLELEMRDTTTNDNNNGNGDNVSLMLAERCNTPIGIPAEDQFQKLLKHFCRKSCGVCGTEDAEEGVSQAVIEAEAEEVAEEIQEKEIEEEIEKEMEEMEKEMEKIDEEIEEVKEAEEEVEKEVKVLEKMGKNKNEELVGQEVDMDDDSETDADDGAAASGEEDEQQSDGSEDEEEPEDTASIGKDEKDGDDQEDDDDSTEDAELEKKSVASSNKAKQSIELEDEEQSIASADEDRGSHEEVTERGDEPVLNKKPAVTKKATQKPDRGGNEEVTERGDEPVLKEDPTDSDTDKVSTEAVDDGTFNMQRLKDTRKAAQDLVDMLEEYYSGADQSKRMMLDAWLDPWVFDEPDGPARKRMDKLVDTMARALLTDDQEEFLIGTIGSSVAAGHDNCHYDSYESQLERTLGPVWEAAGMKLVCQNAGEGGGCGDDYRNQAFCIKQNVSPKVDIAHYSWTYFEEGDPVDKYATRESLIRWTQMLPHQPPVHVLNVLWLPDENGAKQEYELAEYYAKYGYNAFYMRSGHKNGGYDYEADKKNGIDRYAWGGFGDGYHNVTRYGLDEKDPDRKESLGIVMRNWHPGPLAFELVSDTFAFVYAKAMLAALEMIQKNMNEGQDPKAIWTASKRKIKLKKSLPEPKFCDPMYCVVDEAPGCLNYEKPTFGSWGARVEDPDDSLNPHKKELQNWEVWHEDNDIWNMVGKQDTAIFQSRDEKEQETCRHLDQCGGISASSPDNGMVVFRLPKMEVGLVVICGCCGKSVAEEMFLQNNYIEISYNGAVLDRTTWEAWPNGKCVRLLEKFPTEGAAAMTPTGHAYLSIKALEGLWKKVAISHVITL